MHDIFSKIAFHSIFLHRYRKESNGLQYSHCIFAKDNDRDDDDDGDDDDDDGDDDDDDDDDDNFKLLFMKAL